MIIEYYNLLINSLLDFSLSIGYIGTFIWMLVESSFIPWPSELLLIPQGFLVYKGELSFTYLLIASTLGSLIGAYINYFIAFFLGRNGVEYFLSKHRRFLFLKRESLEKSDKFFEKHGEITIFIGRLIPGIRQLISLPAGFSRMNLFSFTLYTIIGAGIWSFILLFTGYFLGNINSLQLKLIALSLCVLFLLIYILFRLYKKKH